jgi:hypothetical protein
VSGPSPQNEPTEALHEVRRGRIEAAGRGKSRGSTSDTRDGRQVSAMGAMTSPTFERVERAITCRACGALYAEESWTRLVVSALVEASEIRRLVRGWPEGLCVEVRSCQRCATPIAVKRGAQDEPNAGLEFLCHAEFLQADCELHTPRDSLDTSAGGLPARDKPISETKERRLWAS